MSPRSIYLRDQAAKCKWHANNIGDSETQVRAAEVKPEHFCRFRGLKLVRSPIDRASMADWAAPSDRTPIGHCLWAPAQVDSSQLQDGKCPSLVIDKASPYRTATRGR